MDGQERRTKRLRKQALLYEKALRLLYIYISRLEWLGDRKEGTIDWRRRRFNEVAPTTSNQLLEHISSRSCHTVAGA